MKKANWIELGLFVVVVAVIAVLVIGHAKAGAAGAPEAVAPKPTPQVLVEEREVVVEKLVEVTKEVTVEELNSGLRAMGFLETQEYFFTDVIHHSSNLTFKLKNLFDWDIPFTETSYMVTYDGSVTAGVDFSRITVERDENRKIIWVTIPEAEIHHVVIDPESFQLISEKSGLGNPLSVEDVNNSLVELKNKARSRAEESGILKNAEINARLLISSFIIQLEGSRYTIRYETAS